MGNNTALCHARDCKTEGMVGFAQPPPNWYCGFHFIEIYLEENPEKLSDSELQIGLAALAKNYPAYEKFLIDDQT